MHRSSERSPSETVGNRIRVVYLMGYGRSGSTVLDAILGSHPSVVSLGELGPATRLAFLDDEYCSCGERASRCGFWSSVRARWEARGGDARGYEALSRPIEGGRVAVLRTLVRGPGRRSAAAVQASPPGAPGAPGAPNPTARADRRAQWTAQTQALFEAIAAATGSDSPILVDSSKNPARAAALAALPGLDVFLVHLVRDGRGVAWSLAKAFAKDARGGVQEAIAPRSVGRTALAWRTVNAASRRVFDAHPRDRRLFLRYEDYVEDLAGALAPLDAFVGGGLESVAQSIAEGGAVASGHTIAGNRLRMQATIRLRADAEWREHMSRADRRRFWRLAGTSLARYGYAE